MKCIKTFCLLLFSAIAFGQHPVFQVKINAITADDSIDGIRRFYIDYTITNLTQQKITFFLNPKRLTSNVFGAMSNQPYYKIFEGKASVDADQILWENSFTDLLDEIIEQHKLDKNDPEVREKAKAIYFEEKAKIASDTIAPSETAVWESRHKRLLKEKFSLEPNENRNYTIMLLWRKDRYFKHDDMEFYLAEHTPHYFEITVNLMKEPFKDMLTKEEYITIMDDKNFIKGVFVSNKMAIDFD